MEHYFNRHITLHFTDHSNILVISLPSEFKVVFIFHFSEHPCEKGFCSTFMIFWMAILQSTLFSRA